MATARDPIAVVEACYDLSVTEEQWLKAIADTLHLVVKPAAGLLAYHVDLDTQGPRFSTAVQAGDGVDVVERIRAMGALLDRKREKTASIFERLQARLYERVIRGGMSEPAEKLLVSECKHLGPKWMYTLGVPGIRDVFHLRNHHIDGQGLTMIAAGVGEDCKIGCRERTMYLMLSAHIKAGLRLRRRLPLIRRSLDRPEGGAVIDADARVVHAEQEASEASSLEELQRMASAIDRARTRQHGRDENALEVWQGLVAGRWSLVEHFDSDGKRFMLAHRNPEGVSDPRRLSEIEARVLGLAARGYSNKLVGYHLGMAEGTASSHLARAMAKMRIASRAELVRTFGHA